MKPGDLPLIGFCAYSGNGKTSLLRRLIPLLDAQGLRVGLVKHAHHEFEIDYPGKDSYELRKAGSAQVVVASRNRIASITESPELRREPTLDEALAPLCAEQLDLVLVEGFKRAPIPKIEIHRPSHGTPLICRQDRHVVAVASDVTRLETGDANLALLDLNRPGQIMDFVLDYLGFNLWQQVGQGGA